MFSSKAKAAGTWRATLSLGVRGLWWWLLKLSLVKFNQSCPWLLVFLLKSIFKSTFIISAIFLGPSAMAMQFVILKRSGTDNTKVDVGWLTSVKITIYELSFIEHAPLIVFSALAMKFAIFKISILGSTILINLSAFESLAMEHPTFEFARLTLISLFSLEENSIGMGSRRSVRRHKCQLGARRELRLVLVITVSWRSVRRTSDGLFRDKWLGLRLRICTTPHASKESKW